MSWNLQQPITSELAANKANKDGTDFTNPSTWRSGLDVVSTNETRRQGTMDYAAVTFDGATTNTRITSTLTGQNIGTGDVSLWTRFRVPSNGPRGLIALSSSPTDSAAANAFSVYPNTSGSLVARIFGASTNDFRQAAVANFLSAYVGQVVDVVVTRAGNTLKIYINGADAAYTETTNGTPPNWSDTITSSFLRVGLISSTEVFNGRIYRSVVFNRALSASDVTELITTGVNPADQWGSQSSIYTSNFTAGTDSFASTIAGVVTVTGNETAPDATTGWLKAVRFNAGVGRCDVQRTGTLVGLAKRFRASATIYNVDCGTQWWGLQADNATDIRDSSAQVSNGSSVAVSQEFASTNATTLRIGPAPSSTGPVSVGGVPSGSTWYAKNVTVVRIGAIVDLDFTIGGGSTAYDRSTNALDGTLFGGVSWTMPRDGQYINGPSTITGDLTVDTNVLKVDSATNNVSIGGLVHKVTGVSVSGTGLTIQAPAVPTLGIWDTTDPSYFTNLAQIDANFYFYNNASGALVFGVGNNEAMRLNSTGFGVGGSPNDKLEVVGSGGAGIRVSRAGVLSQYTTLSAGATGPSLDASSAIGALTFGIGGSTAMTLNSTGLGVGASPAERLTIGSSTAANYIKLTNTGATNGFLIGCFNTTVDIRNKEAGAMNFFTSDTQRMQIDSSGNVVSNVTGTAPTLATNSQMVFNLTSNTNLRISVRGTDGVTRTANITLA